jgi:hypothetical protein
VPSTRAWQGLTPRARRHRERRRGRRRARVGADDHPHVGRRAKTAIDKIDPTNAADVAGTLPTVFARLAEVAKIQGSTTDLQNSPR